MAWGWRGRSGAWPGRGPFSYLPPWQRPGWLFGFSRGWAYSFNPWVCARFPWLPRWWWAYPQYGWRFYTYPYWLPMPYIPYW